MRGARDGATCERVTWMPRPKHKAKAATPAIRDPRPASFAADANAEITKYEFPCEVSNGGGGLAVYATRQICRGERILVERPLVLTVAYAAREHTCAFCLADRRIAEDHEWVACSCGVHYYCSERCANAMAPRHGGVECAALGGVDWESIEEDDRDTLLQGVRILSDRANAVCLDCGPAGVHGAADAYTQRLVGLTPSTATARDALDGSCAAILDALPKSSGARVAPNVLLDILERHSCNLYGVSGRGGEEVAAASFVGFFHLLNHSCVPNVVFDSARPVAPARFDPDADDASTAALPPTFALLALEDVELGHELCISYTSSAEGPAARRDHLLEYYGFECACERCSCDDAAKELDYCDRMDAKRCVVDGCGSGLGVPVIGDEYLRRCVHCGEEFEAEDGC